MLDFRGLFDQHFTSKVSIPGMHVDSALDHKAQKISFDFIQQTQGAFTPPVASFHGAIVLKELRVEAAENIRE